MAIYHSWSSVSGNATSPTLAYDKNYGDTTTYATIGSSGTLARNHVFQCSTSLTGMSACTLKLRYRYWVGMGGSYNGYITGLYSWDGSTWYPLYLDAGDPGSRGEATEASFPLSNFTSTTNLNTLRLRFTSAPGASFDEEFQVNVAEPSAQEILDIAVDVSTGPTYTVNTISGPSSLYAGYQGSYSATVTNDATNNCTWSIVSGGGTLSGAVNDATSSRVTLTAPSASGGSVVLRCRSNLDTSKYKDITVSVPLVGISLTVGPSRMRAGYPGWYQVTVTGHADTRANWSVTGGSLNVTQANSVTWTVPSTPGKYTISGSHVYDPSKTFSYLVYVDWHYPSAYTTGTTDANVSCIAINAASNAYDQNETNATTLTFQWGGAVGQGQGWFDFYGFPSEANLVSVDIQIKHAAQYGNCYVSLSHDGGVTWTNGVGLGSNYATSWHVLTLAPGSIFNLDQVRVRIVGFCGGEMWWNPATRQEEFATTWSEVTVYEIVAVPRTRAYTASTSTVNQGTTPARLYMPSKFRPLDGGMNAIGTTPVAIGSGVGALPYFLGGIAN